MMEGNPSNRKLLSTIFSKIRQIDATPDIQYLIVYSFLYKYCSDVLKDYLLSVLEDKSMTLDEAFRDDDLRQTFRNDAFNMFGYYLDSPDYFMDEVVNTKYSDRFFVYNFFGIFSENVEFEEDSNYRQYFSFIFEAVRHAVNFNKFEFIGENHLIVKEIIFSISKLDVFDQAFPFSKVFEKVCQSRLIKINHDPEYITELISSIIASSVRAPQDVFNPFLNDASLLINLSHYYNLPWRNTFAKSQDRLTYCCSLVKLLLNHFDLDGVFSEFGSPFDPLEDTSARFDVVMSRIPQITARNIRRLDVSKGPEVVRANKRRHVENVFKSEFNIDFDSLKDDSQLSDAVENILSKIELDSTAEVSFSGEYRPLKSSEYLFLINMIDSLKDDGLMVVSMSQSFLFKNSLELLRKYLTYERKCIDAIISVPDELSRLSRSEIIVVFRKNRTTDDIVFIDMSTDFKTKKAPYAVPGTFKRNLILDQKTLDNVLDVYMNRRIIDKFSNVVKLSDIGANEFNLSISRYVDTFEGEFISLRDLAYDRQKLDENNRILSQKIEKMMKELDIDFK